MNSTDESQIVQTIAHFSALSFSALMQLVPRRDVGWNFQVWKFHKFREFFLNISRPLFEIFIEILYFNYYSPITRKNVSQV